MKKVNRKKIEILMRLFDGKEPNDQLDIRDRRKKPIQPQIKLAYRKEARNVNIDLPAHWAEHIDKMAKKLKIQPEFLYRKALQAFFGFAPVIFDDDEYLKQWREVFELEGETSLRPFIQGEDDNLTAKIIRARNKNLK